MDSRSVLVVVTVAFALSLALPGPAAGALFLVFDRTAAPPGAVVRARTAGDGAVPNVPEGSPPLTLYLVSVELREEITSPADPRLERLGDVEIDERGNGSITFRVPALPAGEYTTFIDCQLCARFSSATFAPAGPFPGPFRITGTDRPPAPAASSQEGGGDGARRALLVATPIILGTLLAVVLARRRRR